MSGRCVICNSLKNDTKLVKTWKSTVYHRKIFFKNLCSEFLLAHIVQENTFWNAPLEVIRNNTANQQQSQPLI